MKTSLVATIIAIGIAVRTSTRACAQSSDFSTGLSTISAPLPQPQFPFIILQPTDAYVRFGANAIFSVTALNADGYQWLRNGNVIVNATNSTLTIEAAQIQDVSLYSCEIYKGMQSIPTRSAMLSVYTNSIDPKTSVDPILVYSYAYTANGNGGSCPGSYVGYVPFSPEVNWGWTPDTANGNTTFTASDSNRTNTKVQYIGEYGDSGCDQTTVTIPNPPFSPQYAFYIYFTNDVPTNAYPITLSGFYP